MENRNFFLSHSSEDLKDIVIPVANILSSMGFTFWLDSVDLFTGDDSITEIQEAINSCDLAVVFISKPFFKSPWAMQELNSLLRQQISTRKKRILPVLIDISDNLLMEELPFLSEKKYIKWNYNPQETAHIIIDAYKENLVANFNANWNENKPANIHQFHSECLEIYKKNLVEEINNNLVLELYDKPYYEDICITPMVYRRNKLKISEDQIEIHKVLDAQRISIIGEPGSGKTTALRKLALDLINQMPCGIIPIYISLASFSIEYKRKGIDNFEEFVNREIELYGCPNVEVFSGFDIDTILLLDGWDEIGDDEARSRIKQYLANLRGKFIITSRPEAQRTLPFAEKYEMHPLSIDRIEEFIQLRIKDKNEVKRILDWISSDPKLLKLAENPLNLSIMTIVSAEESNLRSLNKSKLYERAFEFIIRQHHREHPYQGFITEHHDQTLKLESILQQIAYRCFVRGEGRFFTRRELDKIAESVLGLVPSGLSKLLAGRLGIIRDRKTGRMEFFHLWYQEFLAARHIIESDEDLIYHLSNKNLASVLPYVVGLHPDPSITYKLLMEKTIHDPFNFCRAISEGTFTDDQIEALLQRVISFGEQHEPKIPVRIELSRALSQIGLQGSSCLIRIIRNENQSDYARRAALEALSILHIKKGEFEQVLLSLLETPALGLLWHVIEHIGNNRTLEAIEKLIVYRKHPNPIVAGDALWAIFKIIEIEVCNVPKPLINSLIDCLSFEDLHLQGHAIRTLGRLKAKIALSHLKYHLMEKTSGYRWIIPEIMALIGGVKSLEILEIALDDHDPLVIAKALVALGLYEEKITEDILAKVKQHFQNPDWIPFLEQPLGVLAYATYEKLLTNNKSQDVAQIYIARHCKTAWNIENRLQGTKDLPLSKEGRAEAVNNKSIINNIPFDTIVTSGSIRALETAQIYAENKNIPIQVHPGLRELDHGEWEGENIDRLLNDETTEYRKWLENPTSTSIPRSSESVTSAQQRILEAIRDITLRYCGEKVLIITHKHIKAIMNCAFIPNGLIEFKKSIEETTLPQKLERDIVLKIISIIK